MLSVRPKVAELAFHAFSRSLHPELYTIHKSRKIERANYEARIDITNCGHVITWNAGGATVCEVATSAHQPLPTKRLGKGPTEGLLHTFDASLRMGLGALSYINVETRQSSMLVQAIHTFPDDYAIVKVESIFSLPERTKESGKHA